MLSIKFELSKRNHKLKNKDLVNIFFYIWFQKISISLNLSLIGSEVSILNNQEFRVVEGIMSKFVTMKRVLKKD